MGEHHVIILPTPDGKKIIAIGVASSGQPTKKVVIQPGETLGYDRGDIWRVPDPKRIKDPFGRALLERKISHSVVVEVDSFDGIGDQLRAQGVGEGDLENKIYAGKEIMYYDKEVLIVVDYYQTECWRNQHAKVWKIILKKTADRKSAAEVIKKFQIPMGICYGDWWKRVSPSEVADYQIEDLVKRFSKH